MVGIVSRQAHQALKSLATHKTDGNDARELAHLARTGFFKTRASEVAVGSRTPLTDHRTQKLVGQHVALENQVRGSAVAFGIRLPRALTTAFVNQTLKASEGAADLPVAMRGSDRRADCGDDSGCCD